MKTFLSRDPLVLIFLIFNFFIEQRAIEGVYLASLVSRNRSHLKSLWSTLSSNKKSKQIYNQFVSIRSIEFLNFRILNWELPNWLSYLGFWLGISNFGGSYLSRQVMVIYTFLISFSLLCFLVFLVCGYNFILRVIPP